MIDFDILESAGSHDAVWRELFTAKAPNPRRAARMDPKDVKRMERAVATRKKFEEKIASILQEQVVFSLSNYHLYSAVDLAWDAAPITKTVMPLLLYAQGRIDVKKAATGLKNTTNGDKFIKKNANGEISGIDLPKFSEMNINLIRSIIGRRHAAQVNKYNNLFPHFKYESRSMSEVGKVRAEATSQRMDIMADQYDYRTFQEQIIRDIFLYGHAVAFPRCSWERDVQWQKERMGDAFEDPKQIRKVAKVVKEGVCWVRPHPSRLITDNAYPLTSLNSDIGCNHIGFWDVARWGDIANNPAFFNRDSVCYSADTAAWFSQYSYYFNQYYDRINPPQIPEDPTAGNDRKNNVGLYTGGMEDSSAFFTHLFMKVIPKDWGVGTYPFPVWLHLKVAGDATVVFCETMPSSPCAVFSLNENDARLTNISMAHELMCFQDQLTNLYTQLLEAIKADLFAIGVINVDVFPDTEDGKKVLEEFRRTLQGHNFYAETHVLEASFAKMAQLGIQITADNIFKVVRSSPNTQITEILQAIVRVVEMAEKLMNLSPQEQGQPAPREITAEETRLIGGTTESVYGFISDAIDRGRAAMKRICYESLVAKGEDTVYLPVLNRYSDSIIQKAGFAVVQEDGDQPGQLIYRNITGSKYSLVHDYIFTTRDGSERAANSQGAQALVQMLAALGSMPEPVVKAILSSMGKEKVYEIFNEIFRLSGTGVDLRLELRPGEDDALLIEDDQQVMNMLQQLGQAVERNTKDIQGIASAIHMQLGMAGAPPALQQPPTPQPMAA